MRKFAIAIGLTLAVVSGACALMPERWAVNTPLLHLVFGHGTAPEEEGFSERIRVPEGFAIGIYAQGLPSARFLRFAPSGDLLVSLSRHDRIELIERDEDGDGRADGHRVLIEGLNRPHGRDFHGGWLYIAEADAGGEAVVESSTPQQGRLLPPAAPARSSRIAGYLADPIMGLVPTGTYLAEDAVEYDSSLSLDYVGQPSIGIGTDRFGNYAAGGASAFFSDMLGNRTLGMMVLATGTFKDLGGQAFYVNQAKRLNWGVNGGRTPYIQGYACPSF